MIVEIIKKPISLIDRFFIWAYGSELNPLQRSGALVVGLLSMVLISGLYLIFIYSVGDPYTSMEYIEEQWFLGKWLRSFHRYASDICVVLVIYHSWKMLSQRRSWGPRTLAWLSGLLMMCALFISGWTGFVMVWDVHGQYVAQEGARLFQLVPFLRDDLIAAFSGQKPVPGSFFFMNLFLHVAIPLGMIFGLWLHTSKMGSIKIFPKTKILVSVVLSLIALSVIFPAPLLGRGDLAKVINIIPSDFWFNFFIPISQNMSPLASVASIGLGLVFMASVVLWSKPRKSITITPISKVRVEFSPFVVARSVIAGVLILGGVALGSRVPMGQSKVQSVLRFNFLLPNLIKDNCHTPTAEELAGKLSHMRELEICDKKLLSHSIVVNVNEKEVFKKIVMEKDGELVRTRVYEDLPIQPGVNVVHIKIVTKDHENNIVSEEIFDQSLDVKKSQVKLITFQDGFEPHE